MSQHRAPLLVPPPDPWTPERYPAVSGPRVAPSTAVWLPESRPVRNVLITVLTVLVALVVAGFVLAQPILREYPATLTRPDSVAGMPELTDPVHRALADRVRSQILAAVPMDDATVGYYAADADPTRFVLVLAGTHLELFPGHDLDAGFRALTAGPARLTDVTDVDAGYLGGTARCGRTDVGGVPSAFCGWADHGSVGIVAGYDRDIAGTASLMRDIRSEILHRS